jgi:Nuclease A inhibitor-like protein
MSFLSGRLSLLAALALSVSLAAGCASADASASDPSAEDADGEELSQDVVATQTDAKVKAEIEAAAKGASFTSESDFPFHYVSATLATKLSSTKAITETLVRAELASFVDNDPDTDKPLAKLVGMSKTFTEWKKDFTPAGGGCTDDVSPSAADCAAVTKLNDALAKNLRGIKVYYFGRSGRQGHVDGVAVSVLIVGRTPSGNLAGVRTIAIWT